ncbi:PspC domain-containing protein [Flammeovirga yaeyamensis]|uniref:PspC domain-containing protein n=1 Tax=Flammeovirga yaeyamensis TaxID=367791 RepID=A0AAX1N4J0_9BACT|nr:PspC domain-containing protein [Flammeovirga yaeyamensis]MBB3700377.1 phage shock protein C [Flammeovirga yaeyamensis]NMF36997.1 PspC domain-containing protein [Flammeovirga yaeyamensis]QWG02459.1 PspC domain-containing protein [Flammeovirga yaeyamensis]
MSRKLVKSTRNSVVAGVCGGIANYFNIDPVLPRLGFAIATVVGVGSPILIYVVAALVMPKDELEF